MTIKSLLVLFLLVFSIGSAQAAALVPKGTPLQPLPEDTAPNISNNINSPDSEVNQNLETLIPQEETQEGEPILPPENGSEDISAQADATASTATNYWVLLFVGVAGIIGIGIWTYKRFARQY